MRFDPRRWMHIHAFAMGMLGAVAVLAATVGEWGQVLILGGVALAAPVLVCARRAK